MATYANILLWGREFHVCSDGYPNTMLEELKEMWDEAGHKPEKMVLNAYDTANQPHNHFCQEHVNNPSYAYKVETGEGGNLQVTVTYRD